MAQVKRCRFPEESKKSASFGGQNGQINRVRIGLRVSDISNADFPPKAAQRLGISPHTRISLAVLPRNRRLKDVRRKEIHLYQNRLIAN